MPQRGGTLTGKQCKVKNIFLRENISMSNLKIQFPIKLLVLLVLVACITLITPDLGPSKSIGNRFSFPMYIKSKVSSDKQMVDEADLIYPTSILYIPRPFQKANLFLYFYSNSQTSITCFGFRPGHMVSDY